MGKRLFFNRVLGGSSGDPEGQDSAPFDRSLSCSEEFATVETSLSAHPLAKDLHLPVLDIDLPCELRESSPGKHHLLIDKAMPWDHYQLLLTVMGLVGILEDGYVRAAIAKHGTAVRKAGTYKASTTRTYNEATHAVVPLAFMRQLSSLAVRS